MENNEQQNTFMKQAISLALNNIKEKQGGPFAAVVVKNGKIIGQGANKVTTKNDPTAHAEVEAIRDACKNLNSFQLDGCEIYSTCEPCPMCLGAIYWARPEKLYFACSREDAADAGFDDSYIYDQLNLNIAKRNLKTARILQNDAMKIFDSWKETENKISY
ncbi:MAG: nucleoside deaminase [Lentimicrobiaceae bacterium]|jgi:guanine deaminase|nr:nucleoside deaminase [Lentimicrobiaceae bacterium]